MGYVLQTCVAEAQVTVRISSVFILVKSFVIVGGFAAADLAMASGQQCSRVLLDVTDTSSQGAPKSFWRDANLFEQERRAQLPWYLYFEPKQISKIAKEARSSTAIGERGGENGQVLVAHFLSGASPIKRLAVGDVQEWNRFIAQISEVGMSTAVISALGSTIKTLPLATRDQIVFRIFSVYEHKYFHRQPRELIEATFDIPQTSLLSEIEKREIRPHWEHPKRVFDLMIPLLFDGIRVLRADLKRGERPFVAYGKYLESLSRVSHGLYPKYESRTVEQALFAMQEKLRLYSKNPEYQEKAWYGALKKPYVIIYGSFPNGRADFAKGSDIDTAVSYARLAIGDEVVNNPFLGPQRLTTREMERAALEVITRDLGLTEGVYDPSSHRTITERKLFEEGLSRLSPIRFKITSDSIEIQVDEVQGYDI